MSKRVANEVRLSALSSIKPALLVGFMGIAQAVIRGIVNLIFDRRIGINWNLAFVLALILATVWYIVTFLSIFFDLRRGDARDVAKNPSFPATSFLVGVYSSGVLLSMVLMWGLIHQHESVWLIAIAPCLGLISFIGWPLTINCTPTAITQRTRFGRLKRIPYSDVISISRASDGTTTVLGPKETIEHTGDHADSDYFARTVSRRSGKPISEGLELN